MTAERHFGRPGCYANFRHIRKEPSAWKRAAKFAGLMILLAAALAGIWFLYDPEMATLIREITQ